jgi:hypothetical protein
MHASRVKCTTATTGTGALTLSATGVRDSTNGDYLAPAERLATIGNRLVSYFITSGANWARGKGALSADGLTLTRDANESSWNGSTYATAPLSLTGTSTVYISPDAADLSAASVGLAIAVRSGAVFA